MRKNIKDNFEDVYLRSNILKKYFKKVDYSLLNDQNFNKIVSYLTRKHYMKSKYLFAMNGFEIEDVNNVIRIYGLIFWAHSKRKTREKKDYLTMIRYINQRMVNFTKWIAKKFNVSDISIVSFDANPTLIKNQLVYNQEDVNVETEFLGHKDKKINKNKSLELKKLKDKFYENPLKYKKDLCYYATTKHVSSDVRKKARLICKKYNIDYTEWLKNESKKIDFDFSSFTY
jgi:hypothetical protein